jgi:hypothetical protein
MTRFSVAELIWEIYAKYDKILILRNL